MASVSSKHGQPPPPPQSSVVASSPPDRHRFTRSTHGCLTCRRAKVRCDEHEPACMRCIHLRRQCVWPTPEQIAHPRRPKRQSSSSRGASQTPTRSSYDGEQGASRVAGPSTAPMSRPQLLPRARNGGDSNAAVRAMSNDPSAALANSLLAKRRRAGAKGSISPLPPTLPSSSSSSSSLKQLNNFELHGFDMRALADASEEELAIRLGPLSVPTLGHSPLDSSDPASLLTTTTIAAPNHDMKRAFPTTLASQLFHHFCASTSRILVTMGNRRGPNPILSICTPARILDLGSAAAGALRMSVMSVSVAHLATDARADAARMQGEFASQWHAIVEQVEEQSRRLRSAALASVVLAEEDLVDQFDTILATCVIVMIRDVITAQTGWQDNVECAIRLVNKRGGPQAVLKEDSSNFARRFLLENLATHDVFGCFVTGREPALLSAFDVWWYSCVENSRSEWEWESVERTFGVSRGMVELISRVVLLNAQKKRLNVSFSRVEDEEEGQRKPTSMRVVQSYLKRQANELLLELDVWSKQLGAISQHVRVTCGDLIYKHTASVFILGEVLDNPSDSEAIVSSIDCALELCSEASALRQVVMLVWPLLICGSFADASRRDKVLGLLEAFREDYCDDLSVAKQLLLEQWHGQDTGKGRRSFAALMQAIGKHVLLI